MIRERWVFQSKVWLSSKQEIWVYWIKSDCHYPVIKKENKQSTLMYRNISISMNILPSMTLLKGFNTPKSIRWVENSQNKSQMVQQVTRSRLYIICKLPGMLQNILHSINTHKNARVLYFKFIRSQLFIKIIQTHEHTVMTVLICALDPSLQVWSVYATKQTPFEKSQDLNLQTCFSLKTQPYIFIWTIFKCAKFSVFSCVILWTMWP